MAARQHAVRIVTFAVNFLVAVASGAAQSAGDPSRGRQVFERYCIQCHGSRGDGAGEVARWAQPKPRDFRQGVFKFSSTPYGFLPTTADLERVIRDGLFGTKMPPFDALNPRARRDVIAFVQSLSARWRTEKPAKPIAISPEPPPTRESVTQGRELFEANCSKCHGDGSGNGSSGTKLADDWGNPITPANFLLGRGKWAQSERDIYVRIMGGISGTPMPESADVLKPEQAWQIAQYVSALGAWHGSTPELQRVAAALPPTTSLLPSGQAASDSTQ